MELWELLQLPRPDIDKMREEVDEAVYALEIARRKLTERNICMAYANITICYSLKLISAAFTFQQFNVTPCLQMKVRRDYFQ